MNVLLVRTILGTGRGRAGSARRGHKVELATAVTEARRSDSRPYDAIVLDAVFQVWMDSRCAAASPAGNAVRFLMLTARAAVSERVEGLDAGATTTW